MDKCPYYVTCNHRACDDLVCVKKCKLNELYSLAGLSEKQKIRISLKVDENVETSDLAAFTKLSDIEKNINTFVEKGFNLYLHSSTCGNGKTSWAVRLVQVYFNQNWAKLDLSCHVLFISTPSYLNALKRNMNTRDEYAIFVNQNVFEADLVVWDDIASKSGSEYDLDQLFNVLNRRMQSGKANIFTSNLNDTELYSALGPRLASRISRESINIELKGTDKRNLGYQELWSNVKND